MSIWTDELKQEVATLWKTKTGSQIVLALQEKGYNVTRNSIVGIIHRLGLTNNDKDEEFRRRPKQDRPKVKKPRSRTHSLRLVHSINELPEAPVCTIVPLNKTLDELTHDHCRFIEGDPRDGALFCGHPIFKRSYCAGHFALCYNKTARQLAQEAA